MEFTVVVLYRSALTHYTVNKQESGIYEADLLKYDGDELHEPPQSIRFENEGRHCSGNINDQDLMDDIYNAVQSQH